MTTLDQPAPLRLPAILQHQTNHALRQVEAFNAQQREKSSARHVRESGGGGGKGRGKRVTRRRENALFTSNPHIIPPSNTDLQPPYPLTLHPPRASFPPNILPRSTPIPSTYDPLHPNPQLPPYSSSNLPGTSPGAGGIARGGGKDALDGRFGISLKGVKGLLRGRGRRTEVLVGVVETQIRDWVSGVDYLPGREAGGGWKVIDDHPTAYTSDTPTPGPSRPPPASSIPPCLPLAPSSPSTISPASTNVANNQTIPAIIESSRSPTHLSWKISDPFERLITHFICRYYDLVSYSTDGMTEDGLVVRMTHVVLPRVIPVGVARAGGGGVGGGGWGLVTPENSDLSGISSDSEYASSITPSTDQSGSETDTETETERGSELDPNETFTQDHLSNITNTNPVPGYSLDSTPESESESEPRFMLQRTISQDSDTSSIYASSSGSEFAGLGDSLTLPPLSSQNSDGVGIGTLGGVSGGGGGGWESVDVDSIPLPSVRRREVDVEHPFGGGGSDSDVVLVNGISDLHVSPGAESMDGSNRGDRSDDGIREGRGGMKVVGDRWGDKPTFFEYLYGL